MSKDPLVSIIIPAYNAQNFIRETLESIFAQTYNNLEIIVVDDGSTDSTAEVVKNFSDKVIYFYQQNSGGCSAPRNIGIKNCSGEMICFFDADDIMLPDRIKQQVDFLNRNKDVGLVFSDYINFINGRVYPESHYQSCPRLKKKLNDHKEIVLEKACEHLAEENFGIAGCFMVRSLMLEDNFYFDTSLKACEDFHFYYRLARFAKVGIINNVGMLRRFHGSNMSGDSIRMFTEGIKSYTLLRRTEKNLQAQILLNRYIASCWSGISRIKANRGEYQQAFSCECKALVLDFCLGRGLSSLWSLARTGAMAVGLHKSNEN